MRIGFEFTDRCGQSAPRAFFVGGGSTISEVFVRPGNDLHADDLAEPTAGGGARVGCGLHRGDVAGHKRSDQPAAHLVPADELDVRGLQHRVGGLDQDHKALGLNHPQRFHRFCHNTFLPSPVSQGGLSAFRCGNGASPVL